MKKLSENYKGTIRKRPCKYRAESKTKKRNYFNITQLVDNASKYDTFSLRCEGYYA